MTENKPLFTRFFGEKVREMRQKRNISQEKLAEETGLHEKHIGRIERGEQEPFHYTAYKLCRVLRVCMDDIHQEIEEKIEQEQHQQDEE